MKKFTIFVFITLLFVSTITNAENLATTNEEKKVSRGNDGTGEYFAIQKNKIGPKHYSDDLVEVTATRVYLSKDRLYKENTIIEIILKLTVKTKSKIIHPIIYTSDRPRSFSIKDNFGKDLYVSTVPPYFPQKLQKTGLCPNEEKTFTLNTKILPSETFSFIELFIPEHLFGNQKAFTFKISASDIEKINKTQKQHNRSQKTEIKGSKEGGQVLTPIFEF
jgi:hypothetical protein